jgi:hypothetical protein
MNMIKPNHDNISGTGAGARRFAWNVGMQLGALAAVLVGTSCMDAPPEEPNESTVEEISPQDGSWVTGMVDTPDGRKALTYHIEHGRAIWEADIDLGDATEVARRGVTRSNARSSDSFRWPNAIVPYVLQSGMPQAAAVTQAIAHWSSRTMFRFVQRTTEADYVYIYNDPTSDACYSSAIGRGTGQQTIRLAPGCGFPAIVHEIGHVIGLFHEQSRADRDQFITINTSNIQPGKERQFLQSGSVAQDLWPFDFDSIMLYSPYAFAADPSIPTMYKANTFLQTWTPNTTGLSLSDIRAAMRMALPPGATPVHLQSSGSSKCLAADPGLTTTGGGAFVYDCGAYANELWYRYAVPGTTSYRLVNAYTGFCLSSGAFSAGFQVYQDNCHTQAPPSIEAWTAQTVDTYWQVYRSQLTPVCLDAPGTANFSRVQVSACTSSASEKMFAY